MELYQGAKRRQSPEVRPPFPKRARSNGLQPNDYTVGWVCALPLEMSAATAALDAIHPPLPRAHGDGNSYTLGNIGPHNVVIACLPKGHYGTNNAAAVAGDMRRTFSFLETRLMVGIGGGVPGKDDLRLGDVVVGSQVIQSDLGKALSNGQFEITAIPTRPPMDLRTHVSKVEVRHAREPFRMPSNMSEYARPNDPDRLFRSDYTHSSTSDSCAGCDQSQLVDRPIRRNNNPMIFYGKIASANKVLKDVAERDKLARELGVVCFEMEAAGLIEHFNCLVIRGICDYADSHKAKEWQRYAAATAAAYARAFLLEMPETQRRLSPEDTSSTIPLLSPTDDRRQILLESLEFDQKESRHLNIKNSYRKTCQWFPKHTNYIRWLDPNELAHHHGFLWLDGKPGAGKSTMMKYAFDAAKKSVKQNPDCAAIAFFFHARGVTLEKSTEGMYRSLLLQIFEHFPDLQDALDKYLFLARPSHSEVTWDLAALQAVFIDITERLGDRSLTCFIDALDECDDDQARTMVEHFEEIGEKAFESDTKLYICFSSRPYPHINVQKCIRFALEEQDEHSQDLEKYVQGKLNAGKAGRSKAHDEIRAEILRKASGVFLWAVLVVEILNKEYGNGRIFNVKNRLKEIPPRLSDLFRQILLRDQQNMEDLLLCIQWILFAKRPLQCEEYYFAMTTDLSPDDALTPWDRDYITQEYMQQYVLSSSKGLAEVAKSKKTQVVQFIHESVRDYLIKENGIHDLWPDFAEGFEGRAHERLKHCCHAYATIKLSQHMSLPEPPYGDKPEALKTIRLRLEENFPFMEYAAQHVFYHAEKALTLSYPQRGFLQNLSLVDLIISFNFSQRYGTRRVKSDCTLAHFLAALNLPKLLNIAICGEDACCASEDGHQSAVLLACERGYHAVLEVLIASGKADLKLKNAAQRGLFAAAEKGDTVMAKLLLDNNADPNLRRATTRDTALYLAAENGHEEVVKLLLDYQADFDAVSKDAVSKDHTALQIALERGNERIVQLLLARGADVNAKGEYGRTALWLMVGRGDEKNVRLLLNSGADVNAFSIGLGSALYAAVISGRVNMVQLLLDAGVDVNTQGGNHRNALHAACRLQRQEVREPIVSMLINNGVDVNARGFDSETAFQAALRRGYRETCQLLSAAGADTTMLGADHHMALRTASLHNC